MGENAGLGAGAQVQSLTFEPLNSEMLLSELQVLAIWYALMSLGFFFFLNLLSKPQNLLFAQENKMRGRSFQK